MNDRRDKSPFAAIREFLKLESAAVSRWLAVACRAAFVDSPRAR